MRKVIVVYGGGFQPFHQGHMSSYEEAKRAFPNADFYVASSNDTKVRPIPFNDKKFLAQQAGVKDDFVQVKQPVNPEEILRKYNPDQDILILVRSERDPVKYTKKDGSPAYYQPFKNLKDCKPFNPDGGHGYIFVTKKKDFSIAGEVVYSGSQVRKMYSAAKDDERVKIVKDLYPHATNPAKVKKLLDKYIGTMTEELENEEQQMDEALTMSARRQRGMQLKRLKSKILRARMMAMKRFANQNTLKKRARRKALGFLKRRFGGGKAYQDLSVGQKIAIDKKIEKMRGVVTKISARLLPQVRKAEVQRKQSMNKAQTATNENFMRLFEKPELPQDKHVGDREGTQPSKYYKGLDKGTKERRDSHFKSHAEKGDRDPSSYKDAPGDKEAREKGMPQSKHTLKFKQMFGEEVGKKEVSRLDQLVRLGLADKTMLNTLKRAMSKIDKGETLSTQERQATQDLLSTMLDMITNTDQLFNMTKAQLRKEGFDIGEAAYVGNIGIMELAKFYQTADSTKLAEFKKLLEKKDYKKAWALVQSTLGVKLIGKQFESFVYENEDEMEDEGGDEGEDIENDGLYMSSIEIQNIADDAEEILYMLESMEEEPEAWVASKITLAADYLATVRDYLEYNSDYEEDDYEDEDEEESDDEAFAGDYEVYECIREMGIEEIDEEFREDFKDIFEEVEGLQKKAEKSGIPYGILKKVYDRGMAAWKGGHRPGTTPQQWAFARVNSFITKGKGTWGGADSDLAAKVGGAKDKNEDFNSFLESMEWGTDELRLAYARATPGQSSEIIDAKHSADSVIQAINNANIQRMFKLFSEGANVIEEALVWHTENKTPLNENVFRVGSEKYFELFREARKLYNDGKIELTEADKYLITETDIGEIVEHEGRMVPLDCPMLEEDEKDPPLNQPKRGGPKKFYVFVKDPGTGNIKKVSWGDTTGLSVKLNDPEARKSFAARHQCSTQKDRTSAAYWACNTPRYAKQLGLSGGGNFYW